MPHKQNPSTVDLISALSRLVRAQMLALTDAAFQLHERDGTTWRIEWAALPELFIYAGALLARMEGVLLAGLDVREARMRSNLDMLGGLILSERIMLALAPRLGKQTAHHLIHDIALQAQGSGGSFREALLSDQRLHGCFTRQALDDLLDPAAYTGLAAEMVEQVANKTIPRCSSDDLEAVMATQGNTSQSQYAMEGM